MHFLVKYIVRHVIEARKSWMPCFFVSIDPYHYVSTTVLNDSKDRHEKHDVYNTPYNQDSW